MNPGLSCGRCRLCLGGRDNLCPDFRMLGEHVPGGMAEYVVVPATNIVPVPPDQVRLTDQELAAIPISFMTAWQMLVDKAVVRHGETVLVLGAGSGVGVAAIQIAKLFGARVLAAASTDRKLAAARGLGADDVINTLDEELVAAVKRLTARRGADVVVEHTGAVTFAKSVVACARGGRIVTCGATDGYEAPLNLRHVFWRQLSILGSTLAPKSRLFDVIDRVAAGQLRPIVDRVLPLADVAVAHRALEAREVFGKIVLTVDSMHRWSRRRLPVVLRRDFADSAGMRSNRNSTMSWPWHAGDIDNRDTHRQFFVRRLVNDGFIPASLHQNSVFQGGRVAFQDHRADDIAVTFVGQPDARNPIADLEGDGGKRD